MAKPGTGTGKAPNDPTASPSLRSPARGVVPLNIAIAGTRGVPPAYGGFETFAAELGTRLVARGHDVTVYCRSNGGQAPPPVRDAPDDRRGRLSSTGMWNGIQRIVLPAFGGKYFETV